MGIRVVLADDHRLVRQGLKALLQKECDIEIVAEAEDGTAAIKLVGEISPDVVIMDVAMPGLGGIEATQHITAKSPGTRIIGLSMYADRRFIVGMLSAGASGYLLKDCAGEEMVQAIRMVAAGSTFMSPAVANVVVKDYFHHLEKTGARAFSTLSSREEEVFKLLVEGKSAKQIAAKLCLSIKTIETHRQQIMKKLNLTSMAGLIKYAIREGMTSLDA